MTFSVKADPWPIFHHQVAELHQQIQAVQTPVLSNHSIRLAEAMSSLFQQEILPLISRESIPQTIQPYITEVHRQLRLLNTQLSLYQVARTEALQQQRFEQICSHITQLFSYSQAIKQVQERVAETKASPEPPAP